MIESAFVKYLELVKQSRYGRSIQTFKRVMSLVFCNLIGPPRSWHTDPKRYRQSPRPSFCVFILKELNAAEGESGFETTCSVCACFNAGFIASGWAWPRFTCTCNCTCGAHGPQSGRDDRWARPCPV